MLNVIAGELRDLLPVLLSAGSHTLDTVNVEARQSVSEGKHYIIAVYRKNVTHLWHSREIGINPDGSPQAIVVSDNDTEADYHSTRTISV